MNFRGRLHSKYVHSRRVRVLRDSLSQLIPSNSKVLDVGCGDGLISRLTITYDGSCWVFFFFMYIYSFSYIVLL